MSEKVFPAAKQAPPLPVSNGAAAAAATTAPPKLRPQYRPQPYNRGRPVHRQRTKKRLCCCFLFWMVLFVLVLLLLALIAGVSLYLLYHPRRPSFEVPSLRVHRLNLTSSADGSSHLNALFNMTITSRNPNSHISFSYEKFSITALSESGVVLGNGSLPSFSSTSKNSTTFRNVIVSESTDLDGDSLGMLKGDTKRKADGSRAVMAKLVLDTKVVAKAGKLRSKRVGIRVTCNGIRAVAPSRKSGPTTVVTGGVKCKADLRIKIWKFTF